MTAQDKAKNTTQEVTVAVKEHLGKATGDESLETEGQADQAKGNLKSTGGKVKDAVRK